MAENSTFSQFFQEIRDGISICLGYFSVAFAFGIFAVSGGLTPVEAIGISALNVTSAGQHPAPEVRVGGKEEVNPSASGTERYKASCHTPAMYSKKREENP